MKQMLLATIIAIGLSQVADAQTRGSNHSANGTSVNTSRAKAGKGKNVQAADTNQRKMYPYKDGQEATPTGHEATGTNGSAAPMPKDSATAIASDSTRRYR